MSFFFYYYNAQSQLLTTYSTLHKRRMRCLFKQRPYNLPDRNPSMRSKFSIVSCELGRSLSNFFRSYRSSVVTPRHLHKNRLNKHKHTKKILSAADTLFHMFRYGIKLLKREKKPPTPYFPCLEADLCFQHNTSAAGSLFFLFGARSTLLTLQKKPPTPSFRLFRGRIKPHTQQK